MAEQLPGGKKDKTPTDYELAFYGEGDADAARRLLDSEDFKKHTQALINASANGLAHIVELLLADEKTDVTRTDFAAVKFAVKHGHTDVVALLLQHENMTVTKEVLADALSHVEKRQCGDFAGVIELVNKHFE